MNAYGGGIMLEKPYDLSSEVQDFRPLQKILQADDQESVVVVVWPLIAVHDNDLAEGIADLSERAGFLFALFVVRDHESRLEVIAPMSRIRYEGCPRIYRRIRIEAECNGETFIEHFCCFGRYRSTAIYHIFSPFQVKH